MKIDSEYLEAYQHHQAGRLEAAEECCRRVLDAAPNHADAVHILGLIAFQRGEQERAVELVMRAIESDPTRFSFHNNLGNILKVLGKLEEAFAAYRRALELAPGHSEINANLGYVLLLQGKLDEAAVRFQKSLEQKPADVATHFALGNVLKELGRLDEAAASYRRALELSPARVGTNTNLGIVLQLQGKLREALRCFQREIELNPEDANGLNNLGAAFQDQGKLDEAIHCYREALKLNPHYLTAHSNLLVASQYCFGITLEELATTHAEFERLHAAPLRSEWKPHTLDRDFNRPLTLGFISPNFSQHPVGHFVIRALENLDRDQFQVVCYSDRIGGDDWTRRFQQASTIWRETNHLTDAQLANQIRADQIDILFDLAGHTASNRLLVCARKPAPIQITWADYVGTTGLAAIDYLLADRFETPPEAESFYSERILRMPNGYVCYDPPAYAPAVLPLPAISRGFVTFSSFNYRPKISREIVDVWAKILKRVSGSRLLFKYRGMNEAVVAEPLRSEFASRGVEPNRIEFLGWSAHAELLAEYQRVDLALDSFPYNGGLTTCEALWMGVPVITCPGETFASRHGLSHVSNVGLTETIAHNLDDYADVAVSLATDLPRLAAIRSGLRARLAASPLCDGPRFAHDLMRMLREIWWQRCQQP